MGASTGEQRINLCQIILNGTMRQNEPFKLIVPVANILKAAGIGKYKIFLFATSCNILVQFEKYFSNIFFCLQVIRENVMVAIANIAGHTEFGQQPESLVRPILSGLLEWSVSPSAAAQDSFPNVGPHSPISPQRLAIESLCKLCVQVMTADNIMVDINNSCFRNTM